MKDAQVHEVELEDRPDDEAGVDLNRIFSGEGRDLNIMFPDGEMRTFLRQVDRNRRNNLRFLEGCKKDRIWEENG